MRTPLIGISISLALMAFTAQAQTPSFTAASVLNGASMKSGPIAPGMVVTITGSNLGDPNFFRNCSTTYPLPTVCFGTSVLVNGKAAPILNTSAGKLVFQVPFDLTGSTATLQVTSTQSGSPLSSGTVSVLVAPTAPGLFTTDGSGTGTGYYSVSGGLVTKYSQPTQVGDQVVMFGTGFGITNPAVTSGNLGPNTPAQAVATATLKVNGQSVPVLFAGLEPGNLTGAIAGYDEVIFSVPTGLTVPAGQTEASFPVVITVGGVDSQPVNLRVSTPPPAISTLDPNPVPLSNSPQTVTINGSGFQSGANLTVHLVAPNGTITNVKAPDVTFVSSSQITFQITTGSSTGTWTMWIVNPDSGQSASFNFTASGTPNNPIITSVVTTSSNAPVIAPNTWIEVKGSNFVTTPAVTWDTLTGFDFKKGLPTSLTGVSATVNGKPAAIFYVSATQVNVLAPLDTASGTVAVQLTTPKGTTSAFSVTEQTTSPAFLVVDVAGHVAAQHGDYSLLGPSSSSVPGYTFTPAKPNEMVILYATGFGQTTPPITDQISGAGQALPTLPTVLIGGVPAVVNFAGLSGTGLYQFNVVVPAGTPDGEATLTASYNGISTQANVKLTILK